MSKSLKIFLACFIGIICGSLVLSKITGQFSFSRLIIGMIVGGPLGYLAYDFKTVIKRIPKAWNVVSAWRPNLRNFGRIFLAGIGLSPWFGALIGIMLLMEGFKEAKVGFIITSFSIFAGFFCWAICSLFQKDMHDMMKEACAIFWKHNIISTCFYHLPIRLPKAIAWLRKKISPIIPQIPGFLLKTLLKILLAPVRFMKSLFRFIKTLIVMIHRDERLVCMFDAMFGIVLFYFWGKLIPSAIIGGLFAVLNWQIISVRILRLAPSKAKNT